MPDGNAKLDPDSQASQVLAFLRSVHPDPGSCWCGNEYVQAGHDVLIDYATALVREGDNAEYPLTPAQCGNVLHYLYAMVPREGAENYTDMNSYAAGGHNLVLFLLADTLAPRVQS